MNELKRFLMADNIRKGLREAIFQRQLSATCLDGAATTFEERRSMILAEQEYQLARAAYLKSLALEDCSTNDHDPVQGRSSDCPAEGSSP